MVWTAETSNGNEAGKIRWELVRYTRGRVLDLGCGKYKAFPHFIGVDNGNHEQFGWNIRPDVYVETCERLDVFASQSMDAVFSSHLLEHIVDYKAALREWWRVVKPHGHLCLYLPHKQFYPNIGEHGANPTHVHDFMPDDIIAAMREVAKGWDLVEKQDRNEGDEYSMFLVFRRTGGEKCVESWNRERPAKTAAVIRYGAFGDLMQASSVFAGLKKQGYHVTLYSTRPGSDVVEYDPNVDEIILQDKDQVPNGDLIEFWDYLAKKYDHFVNLSESVEGTWLAMPGRTAHRWPHNLRHKMLNHNYLQFQHELAGVPHEPRVRFYANAEEREWARKQRLKMGDFVVMWSLAGSAVHKTNASLDQFIARVLLSYPSAHVVLVGGPECAMLEAGWENEPRVHKTCGKWSIRESLAFLDQCDLVIGPETGVLNAAACMSVPKIVFLSHSSVENLTRDWVNTVSLEPRNTPCFPCHQLHYGWTHCHKDEETGTAKCQADITVDDVWYAAKDVIDAKLKSAA
jgi:ADP-heptose:LPS heptosyltransferase/predicted SAM-dependent methyltransferase